MATAGKPLSIKMFGLSPSSSPRRKRGVHSNPSESCFRQGKSLCPGSSTSRRCLFPRHFGWWFVVSHGPGLETGHVTTPPEGGQVELTERRRRSCR